MGDGFPWPLFCPQDEQKREGFLFPADWISKIHNLGNHRLHFGKELL